MKQFYEFTNKVQQHTTNLAVDKRTFHLPQSYVHDLQAAQNINKTNINHIHNAYAITQENFNFINNMN